MNGVGDEGEFGTTVDDAFLAGFDTWNELNQVRHMVFTRRSSSSCFTWEGIMMHLAAAHLVTVRITGYCSGIGTKD